MIIGKIVKQKIENLLKRQPDLLRSINIHIPTLEEDEVGAVAGLIMEYIIKSGGNTTIFEDNLEEQFEKENLEDF